MGRRLCPGMSGGQLKVLRAEPFPLQLRQRRLLPGKQGLQL